MLRGSDRRSHIVGVPWRFPEVERVQTAQTDRSTGVEPTIAVRGLWKIFGPAEAKIAGSPLLELSNADFRLKTGSTIAVSTRARCPRTHWAQAQQR